MVFCTYAQNFSRPLAGTAFHPHPTSINFFQISVIGSYRAGKWTTTVGTLEQEHMHIGIAHLVSSNPHLGS